MVEQNLPTEARSEAGWISVQGRSRLIDAHGSQLCKSRFLRIADLDAWCSIDPVIKAAVNGRLSAPELSQVQRRSGSRPRAAPVKMLRCGHFTSVLCWRTSEGSISVLSF